MASKQDLRERAHLNDGELVDLVRAGDTEAFSELVERHRSYLVRVGSQVLPKVEAEDAVQEAVLQAFLSITRLRQPTRFRAWITGILLNVCRTSLRQNRRQAWSLDSVEGGRFLAQISDGDPLPEDIAAANDISRRVHHSIRHLPSGQRASIVLFYLSGLTYRELASTLRIPISAAKARLHKARRKLKPSVIDLWEDAMTQQPYLEMTVVDVRRAAGEGRPASVVFLKDAATDKHLHIWIGPSEADHLALALEGIEMPRPGPYQFLAAMLEASGAQLREIRIEKLAGETFYAVAALDLGGDVRSVDARPSDALNLALLRRAPIRVNRAVFEAIEARKKEKDAPTQEADVRDYPVSASDIVHEFRENWKAALSHVAGEAEKR